MLIHSRRVGSRRGNLIRKSACESSQSAVRHRGEEEDTDSWEKAQFYHYMRMMND